jgi:hypothetical protein
MPEGLTPNVPRLERWRCEHNDDLGCAVLKVREGNKITDIRAELNRLPETMVLDQVVAWNGGYRADIVWREYEA